MLFRMDRSNYPVINELGNSREIHDLHQGNIVEELTLHSDYYSEMRGRTKKYLTKRTRTNLRADCRNWAYVVEKTKEFEKVIVLRNSLSTESIPVFRKVHYFNSV